MPDSHDHRDSRATDAPFGPDEAEGIVADLHAGRPLHCPRCKGDMERAAPANITKSQFTVFIVRCPTCRRAVFAGDYYKIKT